MSYLSQINVAVSPYLSRTQRAINFYNINKDRTSLDGGLFLALANGLSNWGSSMAEVLPSLNTFELDNPFKWIRVNSMMFVKSDVDGKLNVGNLSWSTIPGQGTDDYLKNVRNMGGRWLYVDFKITEDTDITVTDQTVRQVGIYSELKLTSTADPSQTVYLTDDVLKVTDTSDNRNFDGILTLIQNVEPYTQQSNSTYSYIIEF